MKIMQGASHGFAFHGLASQANGFGAAPTQMLGVPQLLWL
jgi:hypothetical protein